MRDTSESVPLALIWPQQKKKKVGRDTSDKKMKIFVARTTIMLSLAPAKVGSI